MSTESVHSPAPTDSDVSYAPLLLRMMPSFFVASGESRDFFFYSAKCIRFTDIGPLHPNWQGRHPPDAVRNTPQIRYVSH